jgi:hypothetical protein
LQPSLARLLSFSRLSPSIFKEPGKSTPPAVERVVAAQAVRAATILPLLR